MEGWMRGLKGKRFIVGGGATGIGAALALRLAEEGGLVCVGDINEVGLNKLLPELTKRGKAICVPFDLADGPSITRLVKCCESEFGGLDGLAIPGADLSKETLGGDVDLLHMDLKVWERTLKVNLLGHALLMRAAIPLMVKAGGGSIVSVSSAASAIGMNTMPAYAASKAGLQALCRHVATLCGKENIRCNMVSPGSVLTENSRVNMTEEMRHHALTNVRLTRLGEPDDLASAMAFLLSDDAGWLTGQVISVNGGYLYRD
jgi:NAD(P)-dependent dehydrogenase (short-subunit alcohol dehydrogenase family)